MTGGSLPALKTGLPEYIGRSHDVQWTSVLRGPKWSVDGGAHDGLRNHFDFLGYFNFVIYLW